MGRVNLVGRWAHTTNKWAFGLPMFPYHGGKKKEKENDVKKKKKKKYFFIIFSVCFIIKKRKFLKYHFLNFFHKKMIYNKVFYHNGKQIFFSYFFSKQTSNM